MRSSSPSSPVPRICCWREQRAGPFYNRWTRPPTWRMLNRTDPAELTEELKVSTVEKTRAITGREIGAANLLLTLDRIEGQVTPKWVRDIAGARPARPAADPKTALPKIPQAG